MKNTIVIMNYLARLIVLTALLLTFVAIDSQAKIATSMEMEQVCNNWLATTVAQQGNWAGEVNPKISSVQEIVVDSMLLGRCYSIDPQGFVVVPALKELPAIKAYSEESNLNINEIHGMAALLKDVLQSRTEVYIDKYGSMEASQPKQGEVLFGRIHQQQWDHYAVPRKEFSQNLSRMALDTRDVVGPLLTCSWHQSSPYNNYCPPGTPVGCVATSAAMIMYYWQWPTEGVGSHSYIWDGDGGSPQQLSADFWDPYDWANMADWCPYPSCGSPEMDDALAELNYEIGVAFEMDYGASGSGISTSEIPWCMQAYQDFFLYKDIIDEEWRSGHTSISWFDVIKEDINAGRPIQYLIEGHSIVCDGWSDNAEFNQYHMNFGWDDGYTAWYTVDDIYCIDPPCNYMSEFMVRHIEPDKSVMFTAAPKVGWVPFEVHFEGSSELSVDTWTWDFGDGGNSPDPTVDYSYETPGVFDVTLEVNAGGDIHSRTKSYYVIGLADTLFADSIKVDPENIMEIVVWATNTIPLSALTIPVEFSGSLVLDENSVTWSTVGCLTENFDYQMQTHFNPGSKQMTYTMDNMGLSDNIPAGTGPVLKLYFECDGPPSAGQVTPIALEGYDVNHQPNFIGDLAEYEPGTVNGEIHNRSCCVGIRGNVDNDVDQLINIADLMYLVNYMFNEGPEPPCWKEGNVDGDVFEQINIADLMYLTNYMFNEGEEPVICF